MQQAFVAGMDGGYSRIRSAAEAIAYEMLPGVAKVALDLAD